MRLWRITVVFHSNKDAERALPATREELDELIDRRIGDAMAQFVAGVANRLSEPHAAPTPAARVSRS